MCVKILLCANIAREVREPPLRCSTMLKADVFIKIRGVYVDFDTSMRIETACRFVSEAPNGELEGHTCSPSKSEQA